MSRIAIITDTDSSLPFDLSRKYGIIQVISMDNVYTAGG